MIASLYAIKHTTALFTKKLLEYKFNKGSFLYDMTYGKTFLPFLLQVYRDVQFDSRTIFKKQSLWYELKNEFL